MRNSPLSFSLSSLSLFLALALLFLTFATPIGTSYAKGEEDAQVEAFKGTFWGTVGEICIKYDKSYTLISWVLMINNDPRFVDIFAEHDVEVRKLLESIRIRYDLLYMASNNYFQQMANLQIDKVINGQTPLEKSVALKKMAIIKRYNTIAKRLGNDWEDQKNLASFELEKARVFIGAKKLIANQYLPPLEEGLNLTRQILKVNNIYLDKLEAYWKIFHNNRDKIRIQNGELIPIGVEESDQLLALFSGIQRTEKTIVQFVQDYEWFFQNNMNLFRTIGN